METEVAKQELVAQGGVAKNRDFRLVYVTFCNRRRAVGCGVSYWTLIPKRISQQLGQRHATFGLCNGCSGARTRRSLHHSHSNDLRVQLEANARIAPNLKLV